MISDEELDSAVAAQVISAEQAAGLRAHAAGLRGMPAVDEEQLRLVTGFNDVFVVIACCLVVAACAGIGGSVVPWLGATAAAAAAWLLAEHFVRKRRMALPSITLLLSLLLAVVVGVWPALEHTAALAVVASSASGAIAAWLYWRRFRVPLAVALGVAASAIGVIAALWRVLPQPEQWLTPMLFTTGVLAFGLALHWDASDRARLTHRSDVAFWLHLLAAPLLVHPVFLILGLPEGGNGLPQALAVIVFYALLALLSLAIDRRALMVSALGYVLYACVSALKRTGMESLSFALTALLVGSALLLLSAYWHQSRVFALRRLPPLVRALVAPCR